MSRNPCNSFERLYQRYVCLFDGLSNPLCSCSFHLVPLLLRMTITINTTPSRSCQVIGRLWAGLVRAYTNPHRVGIIPRMVKEGGDKKSTGAIEIRPGVFTHPRFGDGSHARDQTDGVQQTSAQRLTALREKYRAITIEVPHKDSAYLDKFVDLVEHALAEGLDSEERDGMGTYRIVVRLEKAYGYPAICVGVPDGAGWKGGYSAHMNLGLGTYNTLASLMRQVLQREKHWNRLK